MSDDLPRSRPGSYFPEPNWEELEHAFLRKRARRSHLTRILALSTALIVIVVLTAILSQAGYPVSSAQVIYNGVAQGNAGLYRLCNGEHLLTLRETRNRQTDNTLYVLRPDRHEVSFVNSKTVRIFPGLLFRKEITPATLALGSEKTGVPTPNVCRAGDFQFVTMLSKADVHVTW